MIRPECANKPERHLLRGAILSGLLLLAASAAEIPYPAALDAAAVNLPDVSDISKKGLIVGNGELNAIVYSFENEIRLRVSKNDCWDMRITTDENPPPPTTATLATPQSPMGRSPSATGMSWAASIRPAR